MTDQGDNDFDRFDDVFHQYGDDVDEDRDKTADFDQIYVNMDKGNNDDDHDEIDDFIAAQLFDLENNPVIEIQTEEEYLSQKLSQLSASGKTKDKFSNEPTTTAKKRLATHVNTKRRIDALKRGKRFYNAFQCVFNMKHIETQLENF
ncbi:unnamed protein product [Rotaria magnacalcarata]